MIEQITRFTKLAGCSTDHFNPRQTGLYVGLVLEEVCEILESLGMDDGYPIIRELKLESAHFKRGAHDHHVERADREGLLDACVDTAWVSIGCALSQGADVQGAFDEVARANLDKFPGGVVTRDPNGKVVKPHDWRGPDLSVFVQQQKEVA